MVYVSELPLEITRLVLYGLEFLSGIIVFGTTADRLMTSTLCAFNTSFFDRFETAPCNAIVALSVILWLALIGMIVWHCLKFCGLPSKPLMVEIGVFTGLSVMWFIVAVVASAKSGGSRGYDFHASVQAVQAFAWLNFFFHVGSVVVAVLQRMSAGGQSPKTPDMPPPAPGFSTHPAPPPGMAPAPAPAYVQPGMAPMPPPPTGAAPVPLNP